MYTLLLLCKSLGWEFAGAASGPVQTPLRTSAHSTLSPSAPTSHASTIPAIPSSGPWRSGSSSVASPATCATPSKLAFPFSAHAFEPVCAARAGSRSISRAGWTRARRDPAVLYSVCKGLSHRLFLAPARRRTTHSLLRRRAWSTFRF